MKRITSLSDDNIESFAQLSCKDQQKIIFQIYTLIVRVDNILKNIYKIVDLYSFTNSEFIDSDITTSDKHNSIDKENEIRKHYIQFTKANEKLKLLNAGPP